MAKTLCDWSKKELERHAGRLYELVREPRFYCRKCARVANTSKVLCKPRKLPTAHPEFSAPVLAPDPAEAAAP